MAQYGELRAEFVTYTTGVGVWRSQRIPLQFLVLLITLATAVVLSSVVTLELVVYLFLMTLPLLVMHISSKVLTLLEM